MRLLGFGDPQPERLSVALEFVPRDVWVGVFWRFGHDFRGQRLDVYVCLLPCLPIHVVVRREGWR